jgi:hypothetical protein
LLPAFRYVYSENLESKSRAERPENQCKVGTKEDMVLEEISTIKKKPSAL